jgi:hypothetical protein
MKNLTSDYELLHNFKELTVDWRDQSSPGDSKSLSTSVSNMGTGAMTVLITIASQHLAMSTWSS